MRDLPEKLREFLLSQGLEPKNIEIIQKTDGKSHTYGVFDWEVETIEVRFAAEVKVSDNES